jgi:hypothetical protein
MVPVLPRLIAAVLGERVTATFLVTASDPGRIRADLYAAGADFHDARIAFFDWSFTVRARRRAWDDFLAICREPLQQLQVSPAY